MRRNGHHPAKQHWLERAKATLHYHASKLKDNPDWTISDTAEMLNRSLGSISEDILIATWLKTHHSQIEKFKYAKDALAFIREKKKRMITDTSFLH